MTELRFEDHGSIDYLEAWELQKQVHAGVVERSRPDTVLMLEHPPTYTAGKRTDAHERPVDSGGAPVIDVDRGGKITFHGPGQLVAYPIVRLPDHVKVVDFVRRLEEAMIRTCADFGLETARVPGRSGVWLREEAATGSGPGRPERKIAAIGLRVSRGVTMHGVAMNCDVDMGWYDRFVPCGIADAGVTSLSLELGRDITVADVAPVLQRHLRTYLAWEPYDATPDYEPRPEPEHHREAPADAPRIPLLTPSR